MIRAQAETIQFPLADSLGGAIAGATLTATLSKDGGAFTATTNAVTEVGSGDYAVLLTATEMDFGNGVLIVTDGTYATRVQMTTASTVDMGPFTAAVEAAQAAVVAAMPALPDPDTEVLVTHATLGTDGAALGVAPPSASVVASVGAWERGVTADADGHFAIYLPPGATYALRAEANGYVTTSAEVTV